MYVHMYVHPKMKKSKTIKCMLMLSLFCFAKNSLAAMPAINSASIDDQSISISGSNFGAKSPAAPILWERFDDGINGQNVEGNGWHRYADLGAQYNDTQPYSGTLSAYNYTEYGDQKGFNTSYYVLPIPSDQLYVSCMFRHDGTIYNDNRVPKNWRINTPGNHYSGPGEFALSDGYLYYYSGNTPYWTNLDDNGTGRFFTSPEYGSSTWTRHEGYIRYSDPPGASNGYMWAAVGTQQKTFANRNNRPEGWSYQAGEYLLGLMHDQGNHQVGDYHHMWVDDVYIDNTQARIEIGNASTWAACTKKVIQIPTSWNSENPADNVVQATTNQGSFEDGSTAYLYVVNPDGEVNETGHPVTFDGSSDMMSPAAPSGLFIN